MIVELYKRSSNGNILKWNIDRLPNGMIEINHGIFGKTIHKEFIEPTRIKVNEVTSRINEKRKEGYKELKELWDKTPVEKNMTDTLLFNYLNTYLPKYNTTSDGFVLPMLAKVLEDNKPFDKYGEFVGQWKINGLRCIVGAERSKNTLFDNTYLTYHSRTGEDWTSKLGFMDAIIMPKLDSNLLDMMIEEKVCLDGELYLPGYNVNDINSFVKNTEMPQHYKLQYWCYDVCCEDMTYVQREELLYQNIKTNKIIFDNKNLHLNNKEQLIVLPAEVIRNISDATFYRDKYIDLGFEGLIIRNPYSYYQFGKRNSSMFKYKKVLDGLFEIIQVDEDKNGYPIFIMQNDCNYSTFKCTLNGTKEKQLYYLSIYKQCIGKKGLVEYRERSGVNEVPFHAKLVKIYL